MSAHQRRMESDLEQQLKIAATLRMTHPQEILRDIDSGMEMSLLDFYSAEDTKMRVKDKRRLCGVCGRRESEEALFKKCSRCQREYYCSKECQKSNWPEHKEKCSEAERKNRMEKLMTAFSVHEVLKCFLQFAIILHLDLINSPTPDEPFSVVVHVGVEPEDIIDFARLRGDLGRSKTASPEKIKGMLQINAVSSDTVEFLRKDELLVSARAKRISAIANGYRPDDPIGVIVFIMGESTIFRVPIAIHSTLMSVAGQAEPFTSNLTTASSVGQSRTRPMDVDSCIEYINTTIRLDSANRYLLRTVVTAADKRLIQKSVQPLNLAALKTLHQKYSGNMPSEKNALEDIALLFLRLRMQREFVYKALLVPLAHCHRNVFSPPALSGAKRRLSYLRMPFLDVVERRCPSYQPSPLKMSIGRSDRPKRAMESLKFILTTAATLKITHPDHDGMLGGSPGIPTSLQSAMDMKKTMKNQYNMCSACFAADSKGAPFKKCSRCLTQFYCSRECQARHWPKHKEDCFRQEKIKRDKKLVTALMSNVDCRTYIEVAIILTLDLLNSPFDQSFRTAVLLGIEPADIMDFARLRGAFDIGADHKPGSNFGKMERMSQVFSILPSTLTSKWDDQDKELLRLKKAELGPRTPGFGLFGVVYFVMAGSDERTTNSDDPRTTQVSVPIRIGMKAMDIARKAASFNYSILATGASRLQALNVLSCLEYINMKIRLDKDNKFSLRTKMGAEDKKMIQDSIKRETEVRPVTYLKSKMMHETVYRPLVRSITDVQRLLVL